MCGIAFFINYGNESIPLQLYYDVFDLLSLRGTDSSGFYFERQEGKQIAKRMLKVPVESTTLIDMMKQWEKEDNLYKFKLDGSEKLVMMHCRAKTRGSELNNKNNMPIASKNYVLIHNGVIYSPKLQNYQYEAEVDSEEILARVETSGIKKGLKSCDGSMSVAIKPRSKDILYLYRNTNPLELVYSEESQILIGCSNADYVTQGNRSLTSLIFGGKRNVITLPSEMLFTLNLDRKSIQKLCKISVKTTKY